MSLVFRCESCGTRFEVDPRLAGRAGRCKSCGRRMVIPRAPAPLATAGVAAGAGAGAGVDGDAAGPSWVAAVTSSVGLKPLTIERFPALKRPPAPRSRFEDEDDTPGPYNLAGPAPKLPPRDGRSTAAAGPLKVAYRQQVSGLLRVLRVVAENAYLASIPFLMLILLGIVLRSRPMALAGATVVVLLNLVRLAATMSQMAVIPMRASPIEGVLFFIPPITFVVLARRWRELKRPARRLVGPAVTILLIALAFTFIPSLSTGEKASGGPGGRLRATVSGLRREMKAEVKHRGAQAQDAVESLKGSVPSR